MNGGGMIRSLRVSLGMDSSGFTKGITGAQSSLSGLHKLSLGVALALTAVFAGSLGAAMEWESSFAGVKKTLDTTGLSVEQETAAFAELEGELRDMAKTIPIGVNELASLAEAGGALGIAREDLTEFARVAAILGETTDLEAGRAAEALGKIGAIVPFTRDEYALFGDVLVDLGNKGASTESDIIDMAQNFAGTASLVGLSKTELLGWSAAMANVGEEAEAGGSSLARIFGNVDKAVATTSPKLAGMAEIAGMSADAFAEMYKNDPSGTLENIVGGLAGMDDAARYAAYELLGITDIRVTRALNKLVAGFSGPTGLTPTLENAGLAAQTGGAMMTEAEKRFATAESQVKLLKNVLYDLAITIGTALLPHVVNAVTMFRDVIMAVGDLADKNPQLVATIIPIAAALSGLILLNFGRRLLSSFLPINQAIGLVTGILPAVLSVIPGANAAGSRIGAALRSGMETAALKGMYLLDGLTSMLGRAASAVANTAPVRAIGAAIHKGIDLGMRAAQAVWDVVGMIVKPILAKMAVIALAVAGPGTLIGAAITTAIGIGMAAAPYLIIAAIVALVFAIIRDPKIIQTAIDMGVTLIRFLAQGIGTMVGFLGDMMGKVIDQALRVVVDLVGETINLLLEPIRGIVDLLNQATGGMFDALLADIDRFKAGLRAMGDTAEESAVKAGKALESFPDSAALAAQRYTATRAAMVRDSVGADVAMLTSVKRTTDAIIAETARMADVAMLNSARTTQGIRDGLAGAVNVLQPVRDSWQTALGGMRDMSVHVVNSVDFQMKRLETSFQDVVDTVMGLADSADGAWKNFKNVFKTEDVNARIDTLRERLRKLNKVDMADLGPSAMAGWLAARSATQSELGGLTTFVENRTKVLGGALPSALDASLSPVQQNMLLMLGITQEQYGAIQRDAESKSGKTTAALPSALRGQTGPVRSAVVGYLAGPRSQMLDFQSTSERIASSSAAKLPAALRSTPTGPAATAHTSGVRGVWNALQGDAYSYGVRTTNAYASGLAAGLARARALVYNGMAAIRGQMKATSPPGRESPLHEIDKWGLRTGLAWTESLADGLGRAPMEAVRQLDRVERAMSRRSIFGEDGSGRSIDTGGAIREPRMRGVSDGTTTIRHEHHLTREGAAALRAEGFDEKAVTDLLMKAFTTSGPGHRYTDPRGAT